MWYYVRMCCSWFIINVLKRRPISRITFCSTLPIKILFIFTVTCLLTNKQNTNKYQWTYCTVYDLKYSLFCVYMYIMYDTSHTLHLSALFLYPLQMYCICTFFMSTQRNYGHSYCIVSHSVNSHSKGLQCPQGLFTDKCDNYRHGPKTPSHDSNLYWQENNCSFTNKCKTWNWAFPIFLFVGKPVYPQYVTFFTMSGKTLHLALA